MAFDKRDSAKIYRPQDGDDLDAIAERETASGNAITPDELARYNWGTSDPEQIDELLRDELGCRRRGADKRFVFASDDQARGELRIPNRFRRDGLALNRTHQVRVNCHDCPDQFLGCCSFPSVTFATDSAFIRPGVVEHLRALESLAQSRPEARIMVFGHTDAVGSEIYNKKLSERRAWSAYAFVVNDPDAWETLYTHPDEDWGLATCKEILVHLGYDPGPVDNAMRDATRDAMRAFLGLADDAPVANDSAFRKALFAAYMGGEHDVDVPADRFLEPGYQGCGEFNPISDTQAADEANRRVTFYLFHPDRLPNLPCGFANLAPCKRQMVSLDSRHTETFRCSFYDSLAKRCPSENPTPPVADELVFVELCEVVTNGKQTELRPPVDSREQYVNLDREVEPDALRPEHGRVVCLKARVAWKSGKSSGLAGQEVRWDAIYTPALRNALEPDANQGFDSAGSGSAFTTTTTDADGWTPIVEYFLSTYGGEDSTLSATLESTGVEKPAGTYTVWKKFWYQVTEMAHPPSGRFELRPHASETFEALFAKDFIRFEEVPASGSGRKLVPYVPVIESDSSDDFARTCFDRDGFVPFKAHILMVDNIFRGTSKDFAILDRTLSTPVWTSPHSYVVREYWEDSKPWVFAGEYRIVGHKKWRSLPRKRITLIQEPIEPKPGKHRLPMAVRHRVRVDFSKAVLKPGPKRKVEIRLRIQIHHWAGFAGHSQNAFIALGFFGLPLKNQAEEALADTVAHEVGHTLGLLNLPPAGSHAHDAWREGKHGHCNSADCTMSYARNHTQANGFHFDAGTKTGCGDHLRRQDFSRSSMSHWKK